MASRDIEKYAKILNRLIVMVSSSKLEKQQSISLINTASKKFKKALERYKKSGGKLGELFLLRFSSSIKMIVKRYNIAEAMLNSDAMTYLCEIDRCNMRYDYL